MKHQLGQAGKAWFARIPMAETSDMLDYMSYDEVDELAFEAWERMTYGGVGFGEYDRNYVNHPGVYGLIYYSGCETIRVAR